MTAGAADAAQPGDGQIAELLNFLNDDKLEVRRFAAEGVLDQTNDQDFLDYCRRKPRKAARPLLRLAEKAEADAATSGIAAKVAEAGGGALGQKAAREAAMEAAQASAAGSSALQALVNLSTIPSFRDDLVELSAPRRAAEALRSGWLEGRSGLAHWYSMLLANVTTSKEGQEAVCSDEGMVRFLLAAFVAKPRPPARDGYDDPLIFLGKVLGNICALQTGRQILAAGDQGAGTVGILVAELGNRSRRPDIINALRNLCLDTECHGAVIAADVLPRLASFLYPWDKSDEEMRARLTEDMRASLAESGAAMTADITVRHAAAICFLGLCRTSEGREYLRDQGASEILRAWRADEADEEAKTALDAVLPCLELTEASYQEQQANQQQPLKDEDGAAAESTMMAQEANAAAESVEQQIDSPPVVTSGPLPPRDDQVVKELAEGEVVDLFSGIEDA